MDQGDYVIPAASGLEACPSPSEGAVLGVKVGRVGDRRRETNRKECQYCRATVDLLEPHVYAYGRVGEAIAGQYFYVVFCDRTCLRGWALG